MTHPLIVLWNNHTADCGEPPVLTNEGHDKYYGYFQNRFGEQWVFVYDPERKHGELRGGDIGWDTVVEVRDGRTDVMLSRDEAAWLQACWHAATNG